MTNITIRFNTGEIDTDVVKYLKRYCDDHSIKAMSEAVKDILYSTAKKDALAGRGWPPEWGWD